MIKMKETETSPDIHFLYKKENKKMTVSCSTSFYLKDHFQIKEKNKLLFSSFSFSIGSSSVTRMNGIMTGLSGGPLSLEQLSRLI